MDPLHRAVNLKAKINRARLLAESGCVDRLHFQVDPGYGGHRDRVRGKVGVFTVSCEGRAPLLHAATHCKSRQLRYIHSILRDLKCPIYTARLMKVLPGSAILPHRDRDRGFEAGTLRLVVPLIYGKDASFGVRGKRLPMKPGELWWVDVGQLHDLSAGKEQALLLVMDVGLTERLLSRFPSALRRRIRARATFEGRAREFYDAGIEGRYVVPLANPFLLPAKSSRRKSPAVPTRIRIESSRAAKGRSRGRTRMTIESRESGESGEKFILVRDDGGRVRIRGDGPGLFLKKVGSRLRLERRGIAKVHADGAVSYYSASVILKRLGERPGMK